MVILTKTKPLWEFGFLEAEGTSGFKRQGEELLSPILLHSQWFNNPIQPFLNDNNRAVMGSISREFVVIT